MLEAILKSSIDRQCKRFATAKTAQNNPLLPSTNYIINNNKDGETPVNSNFNVTNTIVENTNKTTNTNTDNSTNNMNNEDKTNNTNNEDKTNDGTYECDFSNKAFGVILAFYGVGNAPERKSFKDLLIRAIKEYNCEIVITSQAMKGPVNISLYASGNYFSDVNLISSMDMTLEATVAKLSYLMGKSMRGKELRDWMETSIRGELTSVEEHKRKTVNYKKRLAVHSNFMQNYALQHTPANNRIILPDDVDKK